MDTPDTLTATEQTGPQGGSESSHLTEFSDVFPTPCLPHPHFSTKGGLLYRVVEKEGEVIEQLLVPRPYISKVLFMAHSNMLGAHLGMDKTRERVLASGPG